MKTTMVANKQRSKEQKLSGIIDFFSGKAEFSVEKIIVNIPLSLQIGRQMIIYYLIVSL